MNQEPDYLASRLGIYSSKRKVPHGWELPEDDQKIGRPRPERTFLKMALVSVLVVWLVFNWFGHAGVL